MMLKDFTSAGRVFIAVGYTDLRKGIDGLATLVQQKFELDPFTNTPFLFCGRRRDRVKALYREGDGFVLAYKRLEAGSFKWPRTGEEARALTPQQYRWLMECLEIEQPAANQTVSGLSILVIVPAQVKIREYVYYSYARPKCRDDGTEAPILKTPKAPAVIPGSHASAEAIAHIMTQKFVMASPLYRQEQEWRRAGVRLSRQTMSNWVLTAARDWLTLVYTELHKKC